MTLQRVAVGSGNPVKVAAAAAVIQAYFPEARVEPQVVQSGVPDQPFGDEQTIAGARERARRRVSRDFRSGSHQHRDPGARLHG